MTKKASFESGAWIGGTFGNNKLLKIALVCFAQYYQFQANDFHFNINDSMVI